VLTSEARRAESAEMLTAGRIPFPPSKIAQLARFEHAEDLFHGYGADSYIAPERKIEFRDREEDEADDQGQGGNHENVNQSAIQAEEIGET
jgi:hypothetical protein